MRYFIELAYNGSAYNGWQIQPNAPSVQEELNSTLSLLLKEEIYVVGAGRTDAGVHARFFIAHFDCNNEIDDAGQLIYKLNQITGKGIAIKNIYPVAENMHARFSAKSRSYKYFIHKTKEPFSGAFGIRVFPLPDIQKMNDACRLLLEYNDFTSFSKLHTDTRNNICKLMYAYWDETDKELIFTIKADRFLRNMVRAIVGTLLEIGQNKMDLDGFRKVIESKNRSLAGSSVPGNALFLWDIEYEL